jgi:hypothetical protein
MEIVFKMDGGFAALPGLSRPTTIDTEQLPAMEAASLERQVAAADFFDLPSSPPTYPKAADVHTYTIDITDGARHHQVKLVDPLRDEQLAALVDTLKSYAKKKRSQRG